MNVFYKLPRRSIIVLKEIQPRAFGSLVDSYPYSLGSGRTGKKVILRNFEQSGVMFFGKDQGVARVDRIYIEETDHAVIFEHFRARKFSSYYPAKNTVGHIQPLGYRHQMFFAGTPSPPGVPLLEGEGACRLGPAPHFLRFPGVPNAHEELFQRVFSASYASLCSFLTRHSNCAIGAPRSRFIYSDAASTRIYLLFRRTGFRGFHRRARAPTRPLLRQKSCIPVHGRKFHRPAK